MLTYWLRKGGPRAMDTTREGRTGLTKFQPGLASTWDIGISGDKGNSFSLPGSPEGWGRGEWSTSIPRTAPLYSVFEPLDIRTSREPVEAYTGFKVRLHSAPELRDLTSDYLVKT